jgi:TonB family protein
MSNSYFISILLHVGFFIVALMVTVPVLEKLEDKQITVELIDPVQAQPRPQVAAPKVNEVADQKAEPAQQQALPAKASSTETAEIAQEIKAPMKKAKSAKVAQTPAPVSKVKAARAAPQVVHAKAAPSRAGVVVPETLDDIEASDLDYDAVAVTQAGALNESELDNEFTKVDQKSEAALMAQRSAFDKDLKSVAESSEQELAGIENENKENAKAMSDSLKATRTKNAAVLAKIRAGEIAAENERIAREGALKAARDAAAKAAAAKAGSKTGGNGNNTFGAASGPVRSIENLRQVPGNPKPSYSMEERFQKQQGTVVFQAFVTEQGLLQQFKLMQSTGFRNLDGKTLAALKKWKFYPGQQGWVEIPQTWNLKGEAEEMPTTLRRKVSQR